MKKIKQIAIYLILILIAFYVTVELGDINFILFFTVFFIFLHYKGYTKKFTSTVVNQEPSFYAITYLLLIPIYAILYNNLPINSFYHSTYQFEDEQLESQIQDTLEISIANDLEYQLYKKFESDSINYDDLKLFFNKSTCSINRISEDQVFFDFGLFFYEKNDNCGNYCSKQIVYHMNMKFNNIDFYDNLLKIDSIEIWQGQYDNILNRTKINTSAKQFYIKYINNIDFYSSNSLYLLHLLTQGRQGKPSIFRDNFSRMLYLSATTITTTGFGDIVPITKFSRLLVTSESVLGIILIGLLLNSLSNKITKKNSDF